MGPFEIDPTFNAMKQSWNNQINGQWLWQRNKNISSMYINYLLLLSNHNEGKKKHYDFALCNDVPKS